jgi:hypothetical protein
MSFPRLRPLLFAAASLACAAHAQTVTPPPLPPGSALVRPEPGMDEPERKRAIRAHHSKFHNHQDYTRDDSIYGRPSAVAARPGETGAQGAGGTSLGAGARGPVQDGRGSGPAREKTDRGASSWFFGNDKK